MKIFVNGCSHTQGTDTSLPVLEDGYPYVLERDYGIPTVTKAECGSSNDRIFRSTVSHIIENPHYTHAVIQWTYQDRFETPGSGKNKATISDNIRCYDAFHQHFPKSDLDRLKPGTSKVTTDFYKKFNNQDDESVRERGWSKVYTQMLALNSFLESYNIIPINFIYPEAAGGKANSKLRSTVRSQLNFLFDIDLGMETMLLSHGYEFCGKPRPDGLGPDLHFMKDAHKKVAEWIHEYLKTFETIKTPEEIVSYNRNNDPATHVYNLEDL